MRKTHGQCARRRQRQQRAALAAGAEREERREEDEEEGEEGKAEAIVSLSNLIVLWYSRYIIMKTYST